jgi:hypothetical protein
MFVFSTGADASIAAVERRVNCGDGAGCGDGGETKEEDKWNHHKGGGRNHYCW